MAVSTYVHPTSGAAWDSGTTYDEGDYVTHGGYDFRSLQGSNLNNTPDTTPGDTAYWTYRVYSTVSTGVSNASRTSGGDGNASCTIEEEIDSTENVTTWPAAASGTERFTLTVASGVRHPGYWGSGAIVRGYLSWAVTYITVEWLRVQSAGDLIYYCDDYTVIRNCLLHQTASNRGIYCGAGHAGVEIHHNVIFNTAAQTGTDGGIEISVASGIVSHNTVYGFPRGVSRYGGTTYLWEANASLGNGTDFNGTYTSDSGDYNWSTDSTAANVGSSPSYYQTGIYWYEVLQSIREGDGRLCFSRQWPDDLVLGAALDNGAPAELVFPSGNATVTVDNTEPGRGDTGARSTFSQNTTKYVDFASQSEIYTGRYFNIPTSTTWDMDDGDELNLFTITKNTEILITLRLRRSGSDYQVAARYNNGGTQITGTWTTITRGTTYWLLFRYKTGSGDGAAEWWIPDIQAGAIDSWTGLSNATFGPTRIYLYWWYAYTNNGISGEIYTDHITLTTSTHGEPDDATGVYGNEFTAALTSYAHPSGAPSGANEYPSVDITGTTIALYHVGADSEYNLNVGTVDVAGTSSLTFGVTGQSFVNKVYVAGTSAMAFGADAQSSVSPTFVAGTSDVTFGADAQSTVTSYVAGTSDMVFGVTGQGTTDVYVAATSDMVFGADAQSFASVPIAGTSDVQFGADAQSTVSVPVAGTSAATFGVTGNTRIVYVYIAGTSAMAFTVTGSATSTGTEVAVGAVELRVSSADPVLRVASADPILKVYVEEAFS